MNRMLVDDCVGFFGISRTLLFMWDKEAVMVPDRSFVGGYYLRFVDIKDGGASG